MVLGPNNFSIGARNCVLDQTESTNKAHADACLNTVADDDDVCVLSVEVLFCTFLSVTLRQ